MSLAPPQPPPRRNPSSSTPSTPNPGSTSNSTSEPGTPTWKDKMKAKSTIWSKKAVEKGVAWSDTIGGRVNDVAEKRFGAEAFWPVTGDFGREMDKAGRILRAFTVDGVVTQAKAENPDGKKKTPIKVLRKIPPEVIREAKGLAIFTSMRSGFAPFGGAGGAGIVVAKLPDGSWSAPSSMSPNNLAAGLMIGIDVYDCVLVIRSQKALDSFATHKATIGTELAVAAGPYGAGAAVEAGLEKAPLFSYVRSRGLYAGVELVGQVFVERFDENAAMYAWPGVKAGDILAGKVKVPYEAAMLQQALKDAETGRAQKEKGDALDIVLPEGANELDLHDGETLKLPPTPDQTDGTEYQSDPETELVHHYPSPDSHTDLANITMGKPPPLPTRRPKMVESHSSTSHYSSADEGVEVSSAEVAKPGSAATILPPYAGLYSGTTSSPPQSGKEPAQGLMGQNTIHVRNEAEGEEEEPMSEAERREWEQFYVDHQAEQAGEIGGLAGRMEETHIGVGTGGALQGKEESLR